MARENVKPSDKPESDAVKEYDAAIDALAAAPGDIRLQHRAVLALARAGAVERACEEYRRYRLDAVADNEDAIALGGRLLKDLALEAGGEKRAALARQSAAKYEAAYRVSGGFYSAVNVAAMSLVAGEPQADIDLWCGRALKALPTSDIRTRADAYFTEASRAEILLLQGDAQEARARLERAFACDRLNYAAHASTIRQFRMILGVRGEPQDWLDAFRPPRAAHFAGHIFSVGPEGLSETEVEALKADISESIQRRDIGFGYGALAAGADILIAETLIAEGADLHVVLPTDEKTFIEKSVRPYGVRWIERFQACMNAAHGVHIACGGPIWPDDDVAHFGSQVAMGLAVMRAASLATTAEQLLVWDGDGDGRQAGTARDAAMWRKMGLIQTILPHPPRRANGRSAETPGGRKLAPAWRLSARLSISLQGAGGRPFSSAEEARRAIGPLLTRARKYADSLIRTESVREGVLAEFEDAGAAARCALDLAQLRSADIGAPEDCQLRIGAHYGPAARDGRAAESVAAPISERIAAAAVPGAVYISEPMAAILAARHPGAFACEYVGRSLATGVAGVGRIFSLRAGRTVGG